MNDILKTLYYVELEENENLGLHEDNEFRKQTLTAYEKLFRSLSDEQKSLFFVYEEKHNAEQCHREQTLYGYAFKSAFRLAQELLIKNENPVG